MADTNLVIMNKWLILTPFEIFMQVERRFGNIVKEKLLLWNVVNHTLLITLENIWLIQDNIVANTSVKISAYIIAMDSCIQSDLAWRHLNVAGTQYYKISQEWI